MQNPRPGRGYCAERHEYIIIVKRFDGVGFRRTIKKRPPPRVRRYGGATRAIRNAREFPVPQTKHGGGGDGIIRIRVDQYLSARYNRARARLGRLDAIRPSANILNPRPVFAFTVPVREMRPSPSRSVGQTRRGGHPV